jgi:Protein of unknwon function (DUF3310)
MATKVNKTQRIRTMLTEDVSPAVIAKKVKVSKSYVYTVRSKMRKASRKRREHVAIMQAAEGDAAVRDPFIDRPVDPLDVQVGGEHYKDMPIQPVQFIVANNIGFLEGCIIKRICRWKVKGGTEDLQKIKHEVDLLIRLQDD